MIIPKLAMKGGKKNTIVGSGTIVNYLVYSFFTMMIFSLYKEYIFPIYYFGMQTQYRHCLIQQKFIYADSYQSTAAFFSIFGVTRESYWFHYSQQVLLSFIIL